MSIDARRLAAYYDASLPTSVTSPGPHIATLTPSTVSVATGQATIMVNGSGFENGSVVEADGAALTTTFVNASRLTAPYTPTAPGTVIFTVRNPDDAESNDAPLTVGALQEEEALSEQSTPEPPEQETPDTPPAEEPPTETPPDETPDA